MKKPGMIYALQCAGTRLVKIGWTRYAVEKRIEQLQRDMPYTLQLLAAVYVPDHAAAIEHAIHVELDAHRRWGEWFDIVLTPEDFACLIERATEAAPVRVFGKLHGKDEHVDHQPTVLGEYLEQVRIAHGWSRAELARRASCMSPEAIRQIEVGIVLDPGVIKMRQLAHALGMTVDDFFNQAHGISQSDVCLDSAASR